MDYLLVIVGCWSIIQTKKSYFLSRSKDLCQMFSILNIFLLMNDLLISLSMVNFIETDFILIL